MVFRHNPPGQLDLCSALWGRASFDTGGISIKPADGMERMKDDMAGGAYCVRHARDRQAWTPIRVIGIVPATENMPVAAPSSPATF
jgi:leucyl aminopeptidase